MSIRLLLGFLMLTLLTNCQFGESSAPSILIIGVENLPFSAVRCHQTETEKRASGFHILCNESVRFTHAYTPAVLSQPTIASVLTGRYPFELDVWHNGAQGLSSHFDTITEKAHARNYRTAFFSGGPPIWRKSGFHQGFEKFDDHVEPSLKSFYRPVQKNFDLFFRWLNDEVDDQPFFSFIYLPDLQFTESETMSDLDVIRNRSYKSQLHELDESLSSLIKKLKSEKRWNSTFFVLMGLNGLSHSMRTLELKGYNLFSENTRVSLFIKPITKKRDLGLQWKVDRSMTLVDVGATLFDLIEGQVPKRTNNDFEVVSLKDSLEKTKLSWDPHRLILTESGWAQWKKVGESRFSVRRDHFLYFHQNPPRVYNTLIDQRETTPISTEEALAHPSIKSIISVMKNNGFLPWTGLSEDFIDKIFIGSQLWNQKQFQIDDYRNLIALTQKRPFDKQVLGWRALSALKQSNWKELHRVGTIANNPHWLFVAQKNQDLPSLSLKDPCLSLLTIEDWKPSLRQCYDLTFIELVKWIRTQKRRSAEKARERFLRKYALNLLDQKIAELNYMNGLVWDLSSNQPSQPSLTDLALALPKYQKVKTITVKRTK